MNICHVAYCHYPDEPRVRREAETLQENGYQVHVIAVQRKGESREGIVEHVRVHRIPMCIVKGGAVRYAFQYLMFLLLSSCLLLSLHLRLNFRIVTVKSLPDFEVFATLPEKLSGAKVVLDLHEAMPEIVAARLDLSSGAIFVRITRLIERISCKFADLVLVPARNRRELLVSRGTEEDKIAVVTNAPDGTFLDSQHETDPSRSLQLEGRWVIVHAGGINEERDLATLIQACRLLSAGHPTTLLIFGRDDERYVSRLRQHVGTTSDNFEVRFGGWISQRFLRRYLELCTVGVVTYARNPITELAAPNRVLELAAIRKPLVLANVAGLRAAWQGAALFYEPGNAQDLASKIAQIAENRELASRLARSAWSVYDDNNWNHSKAVLLSAYRGLGEGVA